jgi:hypothetical protein
VLVRYFDQTAVFLLYFLFTNKLACCSGDNAGSASEKRQCDHHLAKVRAHRFAHLARALASPEFASISPTHIDKQSEQQKDRVGGSRDG